MKESAFNPERLDVKRLAHEAAKLSGAWPQERFTRLTSEALAPLADGPGIEVDWTVAGEERAVTGVAPQLWLHLHAQTQIRMECQRCLMPMTARMKIDRHFLFARDEEHAAQLDEELEDEVLVLARTLDLAELVEDELILALPIVPRHETCPVPLRHDSDVADVVLQLKPNPFAVLAALKKPGPADQ